MHSYLAASVSTTNSPFIQPQLKVGAPGDKYEQEADAMADRVMAMPQSESSIRRKCASCEEELQMKPKPSMNIQMQPMEEEEEIMQPKLMMQEEEEEELIQAKSKRPANINAEQISSTLSSNRNNGSALSDSTNRHMSQAFNADFSGVKVHTDSSSVQMNQQLGARAFTYGNSIYFNKGEYNPNDSKGKRLLAHELTHVMQQGGTRNKNTNKAQRQLTPDIDQQLQKSPQKTPGNLIQLKRIFTPGRPAHNHTPGKWTAVQAAARSNCDVMTQRGRIECSCAALSPANVLTVASGWEMFNKPLARAHLNHYLSGGGADYIEDANLVNLINQDATVRHKIGAFIGVMDRGHLPIWQGNYSVQDFRYAFGGIDRVDYEVDRAAGTVDIWFIDRYDFHPAGFGYVNMGTGDSAPPGRITNCVHAAAVELKSTGSAADFWMKGEATVPLSLFTSAAVPPSSGPTY